MGLRTTIGKKSPNMFQIERRGLLAKVHIAKKQLALTDGEYRAALSGWGVASAGALSVSELSELVAYFEQLGFVPKRGGSKAAQPSNRQAEALRARIRAEFTEIDNGEKRLDGLVKKMCRVDRLEWCHNPAKLKQLLRIAKTIKEEGP